MDMNEGVLYVEKRLVTQQSKSGEGIKISGRLKLKIERLKSKSSRVEENDIDGLKVK